MAAPAGNQFWKARTKHGRDKLFSSAESLWDACCEYFEWVEENPLLEDKVTSYQGVNTHEPLTKMRAMTITGLCLFLDVDRETWARWRSDKDFCGICTRAEDVMYTQKLSGAAADLLNANIIARELGLREATTNEHTGHVEHDHFLDIESALAVLNEHGIDTASL